MKPRGRSPKIKVIKSQPRIEQFSPRGKPGRPDEISLKVEEFEAIRLGDYLNLAQKEAAKSMHISQQTFSRILKKARNALADGIINGKIIKVKGGTHQFKSQSNKSTNIRAQI